MICFAIVLVIYIAVGFFDCLSWKKPVKKAESLKKYVIRGPIQMAKYGAILAGVMVVAIFWGAGSMDSITLADISGQWDAFMWEQMGLAVAFLLIYLCGIMLMLSPVPGFYDVVVEGDNITVIRFFVFRKNWKFIDIVRVKTNPLRNKCYVENSRREAFQVYGMAENSYNFFESLSKYNRLVIYED